MAGVPLRDVQELMGHQSFETTLQYAHLSEEHVKSQVANRQRFHDNITAGETLTVLMLTTVSG